MHETEKKMKKIYIWDFLWKIFLQIRKITSWKTWEKKKMAVKVGKYFWDIINCVYKLRYTLNMKENILMFDQSFSNYLAEFLSQTTSKLKSIQKRVKHRWLINHSLDLEHLFFFFLCCVQMPSYILCLGTWNCFL